jgi:hypothetical protein
MCRDLPVKPLTHLEMTGHKKFSNLTKDFSAERKAKIATQTTKLKEEMALRNYTKL